jgi:probable FeS assembly SUF system protein SufT
MQHNEPVTLTRDVEASVIPVGTKVTLQSGELAHITQSLGGTYTVVVNGNMFRVEGKDADALGLEVTVPQKPAISAYAGAPINREQLEKEVWAQMRTCYDPEIPVNIVDLGLVYDCKVEPIPGAENVFRVEVKMTLTAPGCGMGPTIQADVQSKLLNLEGVDDVDVQLVWEPQWNRDMLTEAARLQLGLD